MAEDTLICPNCGEPIDLIEVTQTGGIPWRWYYSARTIFTLKGKEAWLAPIENSALDYWNIQPDNDDDVLIEHHVPGGQYCTLPKEWFTFRRRLLFISDTLRMETLL